MNNSKNVSIFYVRREEKKTFLRKPDKISKSGKFNHYQAFLFFTL